MKSGMLPVKAFWPRQISLSRREPKFGIVPEKKFPSKLKSVKSTTIAQININGKLDYFDEEEIVYWGLLSLTELPQGLLHQQKKGLFL